MPNWVFNHLSIEGDAEQIKKVKEQLNRPLTKHYKDKEDDEPVVYSNPIFSFWNIIAPPDDKLDEYFGTHGFKDGERQGDSAMNWYNFNNREWGTKWDVAVADNQKYAETELQDEEDNLLHYKFDTAWSPPIPAIDKLAEQYPELTLTLSYEEEGGWGGEMVWENGEGTETESYSEPNSHADYVARDKEYMCNCANYDDQDDWYDDCPGKSKPIELHEVRDVEVVAGSK